MKTMSVDKIKKAARLQQVIEFRKEIEKEESALKEFFKEEIQDGVLEAGDVVIIVELKSRTSIDRDKLKSELGDRVKEFETKTEYKQVNVRARTG